MDALPSRPTVTLALIAKNEEKNLPRLLDSVEGCFDEIILVDTGSTDKTKAIGEDRGCRLYDFKWIDNFAAARNFAFSKATKEYIVWLDCDDVLFNREGFIKWRDHAMQFVDVAFVTYNYLLDKNLKPIIAFVRERCFRRSINPEWQYPIHEGIVCKPQWASTYVTTWAVNHLRDEEDMKADKSRNIKILDELVKTDNCDARMWFYYGKELYEANRASEAIPVLEKAIKMEDQQPHDRLLAIQYGGYASMGCFEQIKDEFQEQKLKFFNKALAFAHEGIRLEPNRAEFYILVGDAYIRIGNLKQAVPYFAAAKACLKDFNTPYEGAIYSFKNLYGEAPSLQLSKIYAHLGLMDKAKKEAQECIDAYGNEEAKSVLAEVSRIATLTSVNNNQVETEDIVFSCPPQNVYEFDEEGYKTKAYGGSETALIQMARLLKEKTGRTVKVFAMRNDDLVADSGVEYLSNKNLSDYFSKNKPKVHVQWRHNIKLTNAKSYLWCHDLFTPTVESGLNADKFLALSPFHKNYTMALQGLPEDKIIVTRNGIDPSKFNYVRKPKNPNKFVYMSSPDRGLDRAMMVMDLVRKEFPDAELHVYYGIENLYKYGPAMAALADKLKGMMSDRPWVKYHGFTEQNKMYEEVSDAVVWIHPCNFIETYCISALECLANGIFPVTRRLGALADTLKDAEKKRQAILIDHQTWDDEAFWLKKYADACCRVVLNRQWENIEFDLDENSWANIADTWIEFMGLNDAKEKAEIA